MNKRTCSIDKCIKPHAARGWCDRHYRRWLNNGDPLLTKVRSKYDPPKLCTNVDCDRPSRKLGCCASHYEMRRIQFNLQARISSKLRIRINRAVTSKFRTGSVVRDLGCSIKEFKIYIQNQFSGSMNWENHGEWHFDHIRPLSSFDLTDRGQFLEAVHYTNYQPLWAADNMSKGSFYDEGG